MRKCNKRQTQLPYERSTITKTIKCTPAQIHREQKNINDYSIFSKPMEKDNQLAFKKSKTKN